MKSFSNYITELFDGRNTYDYIEVKEIPDEEWFETEDRTRMGEPNQFNDSPQDRTVTFKFKSDSGTYFKVLYSTKYDAERWDWNLVFVNRRKTDGTYIKNKEIMGGFETKEVIKILNTVMKTIRDMLGHRRIKIDGESRDYRVRSISFSATKEEPSRVKLYKRMFKKFGSQLDGFHYKQSSDDTPDKKGYFNFKIERTTAKERNAMLRKKWAEEKAQQNVKA